jgi:type I restriction enzyme S subunit
LYICFKSHGEQHDAFWEQYFEAVLLNIEISKISQEGARNNGLLNVSVTEFFRDITVHAPCGKEQVKIAEFLGALDKKLALVSQQIEQNQTFNKGLLQQMFV